MNITDIIGKGKDFEPPFQTDCDGAYIFDKNGQMVLETRGWGYLTRRHTEREAIEVQVSIATHVVKLLNKEYNKE